MSPKWLLSGAVVACMACASVGSGPAAHDPLRTYDPGQADTPSGNGSFAALYRQMGLAASLPPISFVARAGSFATQLPDTSIVLVGLSIPNRGLTFRHVAEGNAASYVVDLAVESAAGVQLKQSHDSETVRVPTAREISRADESIIYRRAFRVPPGEYSIVSLVRDVGGMRQSEQRLQITVPRFTQPSVSTPVPVYEGRARILLDSTPDFLPAPRGSYVFGEDDSVAVYMESYGPGSPVTLDLRDGAGLLVWTGRAELTPRKGGVLASGLLHVPLGGSDMGLLTLRATRPGSPDTTSAALFLGFGPDLPVISFDQMLSYLRFFARPDRLKVLRAAPLDRRSSVWADFLRSTDPDPSTPRNEALDDYFVRIRDANETFRGDVRGGWLSDRGTVYVGLGQPSAAYEQEGYLTSPSDVMGTGARRSRLLIWEYADLQARVVFFDQMESGVWRLTQQSRSVFPSLLYRKLSH